MSACSIKVHGVVQGVGFRPFVYRLARAHTLAGWVFNGKEGVEIFLEGAERGLQAFVEGLKTPPPAALITGIEIEATNPAGLHEFTIRESVRDGQPSTRISPDLAVCADCLRELVDPGDPRYHYPYINCTNCGPRYSVLVRLPYDRPNTTMKDWRLDSLCERQYNDPLDRRFHAQPVACPACGPGYRLKVAETWVRGSEISIRRAAELLRTGKIVAVKGLGGYHLACDAGNAVAVQALRERKFRKEKPFALMVKDADVADRVVHLSPDARALLTSVVRPIVVAPASVHFEGVAPDNHDLGVMLPYTPLHHLLFDAGAPEFLVMTSANRSNEPIAYEDDDALERLASIADAFLIGERAIARRVDDSIVSTGPCGTTILRRARGYAPSAVAALPAARAILALGADLKNTVTLVVDGQAFVSHHLGDLSYHESFEAFQQTIEDLLSMYDISGDELLVVHDGHPEYASTVHAAAIACGESRSVQHHRAHVASVLAERGEWNRRVVGVSFDGTGYGDDGAIWGGEIFTGSVREGFRRECHLRPAALAGGDAAAQYPVQAAAGFLDQIEDLPDMTAAPFYFPEHYGKALALVRRGVRTFSTTSMGRLFDAAAALVGFTRGISFEGQAAMWLEQLARDIRAGEAYAFPASKDGLDFRPLLQSVAQDRCAGRDPGRIARAFHRGVAQGLCHAVAALASESGADTVVLSGGVFQNQVLLEDVKGILEASGFQTWINRAVPPNDGGISLGKLRLQRLAGLTMSGPVDIRVRQRICSETMHELSIAMSIIEFAEEESARRGVRIMAVHLRLGLLSGVVKDALLSSYEMACEDTSLAGSTLVVEEVPVMIFCANCDARRPVISMQWFCCSECGTPAVEVVEGKELLVTGLEVEQ